MISIFCFLFFATKDSFLKRMISFRERMSCSSRGGFVPVAVRFFVQRRSPYGAFFPRYYFSAKAQWNSSFTNCVWIDLNPLSSAPLFFPKRRSPYGGCFPRYFSPVENLSRAIFPKYFFQLENMQSFLS